MAKIGVTRGFGLLENFLGLQRGNKAMSLISDSYKKGRILDIGCGYHPLFLLNSGFSEKYGIDKISPAISAVELTKKNKFFTV